MSYRLFISHAWKYHDGYDRIIRMLDDAAYFSYTNYSVPCDDKFDKMSTIALKEELRDQIRPVDCVIALAGVYMSYSDWIQFELDFAKSLNKPIIGVKPWGQERVSTAVSSVANEIVGWNTASILQAIRRCSI